MPEAGTYAKCRIEVKTAIILIGKNQLLSSRTEFLRSEATFAGGLEPDIFTSQQYAQTFCKFLVDQSAE